MVLELKNYGFDSVNNVQKCLLAFQWKLKQKLSLINYL